MLCDYIKNKNIPAEDVRTKLKITINQLNDILQHEQKDIKIMNPHYKVTLLNKNIDLGSFKVKINSLKILNKEELEKIINSHNPEETVTVEIIMTEEESNIILDFNNEDMNKPCP